MLYVENGPRGNYLPEPESLYDYVNVLLIIE